MTEVLADLDAGVLRLSRSRLMDLASVAGTGNTESVDEEGLKALEDAGLVSEGTANPAVELVGLTVFEPLAGLRLEIADRVRRVAATGWIGPELSVLAIPEGDGLEEIKACPTGFLPARLAGYLSLGPRRHQPGSALVEKLHLDAATDTTGIADRIRAALRLRWRVTVSWKTGSRSLEVIDAGEEGLWIAEEEGELLRINGATATEVWVRLLSLLPKAEELEPASAGLG